MSAAKAELLQQHVDALRDELRRKDDDMADQRATSDAERQALQEKCNALEVELEKCRGQASLDVQAAERRADSLAKEARALQARADRLEELGGNRRRKPAASSSSSSSSKTPRSDDDDDEELYHTRAALAAHMRLADAYANQHALQQVPDERAEQLNERVLARARGTWRRRLAGSRPLGAFYSRMLERIESTSSTVPLKKAARRHDLNRSPRSGSSASTTAGARTRPWSTARRLPIWRGSRLEAATGRPHPRSRARWTTASTSTTTTSTTRSRRSARSLRGRMTRTRARDSIPA